MSTLYVHVYMYALKNYMYVHLYMSCFMKHAQSTLDSTAPLLPPFYIREHAGVSLSNMTSAKITSST